MDKNIGWWNIKLGQSEGMAVVEAINNRCIAQGKLTAKFEKELAEKIGVPYVVCTTSGTSALMMAYLASGVGPGTEVIISNHTAPGTAHAAMILGAKVIPIDLKPNSIIIDEDQIEAAITDKTKLIVPVHMNGQRCMMEKIMNVSKKHQLIVVEDACQALLSSYKGKKLGTTGRFGCFSLGLAKMVVTGQGGLVCCSDEEDYKLLIKIRNQGIDETDPSGTAKILGANFKFNDILASVGLEQLSKAEEKINNQVSIHNAYQEGLKGLKSVKFMPVDVEAGEVPLRAQCVSTQREEFIKRLMDFKINANPHVCSIHEMPHIGGRFQYQNSILTSKHLLILPSGPDQPLENVKRVIEVIRQIDNEFKPWEQCNVR